MKSKVMSLSDDLIKIDIERNELQLKLMKNLVNNQESLNKLMLENKTINEVMENYNDSLSKHFEMIKKYEELKEALIEVIEWYYNNINL